MKISIYLISMILILTNGCKNATPSGKIISEDKMVFILTDMHIAEAGLSIQGHSGDSLNQFTSDYYHAIFKKFSVSKKQFILSYNYYLEHPEKLQKIYEKVNESMGAKDSELREE